MTRNISDINVAGVFRTVEKEPTSSLPYLSNPAIGSESKQRASTKAGTSIVDKSLSIDYKMPRSALPKNNFNKYLMESREELASISSVHLLGTETPSGISMIKVAEQNSSSKRIPRKATKSEVPVVATKKTVSQALAENEEKVMQMLDRINYNTTALPNRNKARHLSQDKSYSTQNFRYSQSPENAYKDM